jgi:uncharacterized membrane protein
MVVVAPLEFSLVSSLLPKEMEKYLEISTRRAREKLVGEHGIFQFPIYLPTSSTFGVQSLPVAGKVRTPKELHQAHRLYTEKRSIGYWFITKPKKKQFAEKGVELTGK